MYRPEVSGQLVSDIFCSVQRIFQKNKIEGGAYPGNAESDMHDPYHNIQPLHQVSFVYSSFHHKINTGNDGDKDENNGGIQPALNQACFFLQRFVRFLFVNRMHFVCHNNKHDKNGGE